ncbi:MAG: HEAT repeat domain-containing protein [Ignavibacteria bacterium]|nr:HEAT repeat domain-containing protein [Ignavibacteria bacterium]
MKKFLFVILTLVLTVCANAQDRDINNILDQTLTYRGLTRQDVTIPIEFFSAAEKSPTNDAKLILPLVKDMMVNPLRSMTWLDSLSSMNDSTLRFVVNCLTEFIYKNKRYPFLDIVTGYKDENTFYQDLVQSITSSKKDKESLFTNVTIEERAFIDNNLLSIFEESDNDNEVNVDILKFNEQRDSSIATSKKTMDLLSQIKLEKIVSNYVDHFFECYQIYEALAGYRKINQDNKITYLDKFLSKNKLKSYNNNYISGDYLFYYDHDGIRIAIGGPGKNIYTGNFDFIIDLGGDDVYNIDKPTPSRQGETLPRGESKTSGFLGGFSCIIDLSGNDFYTTSSDFALAGGLFSSSFIFDKAGDDVYESKGTGNLGAAIGGFGLLYDEKGNDTYRGLSFSIGAGCFGVGLLVDREGNDFYIANSYSQGFGMTEGVGAIVDNKGNDSYLVDSRSLDIGRYNDHYVSMCQGYGLGLRPYYAGGIGLIIEGEGNDIYNADIFGQGGAYWYSLGAIVDKSGHDKYNAYQYGQGAGIHLAVGLLKDYDGWDFYQSNGVSQGCGHDFGYGMLWDVKGNDNYSAFSLSQGAGNADGIGILIDESGTDGYLNKYPNISRGYGNPRREFGSLGIFLDASGVDYYSQPGLDSTLINSSQWGVFNDFYLTDLSSQVSGDNFKVPLDSSKNLNSSEKQQKSADYSIADYFIMAKTIEPRFSAWQEYGQRKLIEDSLETAKYVLTRLGTDDHRETQVMRVLALKIQSAIADALVKRLGEYMNNKNLMTQPEVSFACYIFGETKNPQGKDILLQLTYDDNYRIRSSAVNALGKIKYDTTDADFINKTVNRLGELASEKSEKKLYNKDIAFALGNFVTNLSFDLLLSLLYNPYYGARFVAAENLKKFPQLALMTAVDSRLPDFPTGEIPFIAFMQSITSLGDIDFKIFVSFMKMMPDYQSDAVKLNLLEAIKQKKDHSVEAGFIEWCSKEMAEIQIGIILKVR